MSIGMNIYENAPRVIPAASKFISETFSLNNLKDYTETARVGINYVFSNARPFAASTFDQLKNKSFSLMGDLQKGVANTPPEALAIDFVILGLGIATIGLWASEFRKEKDEFAKFGIYFVGSLTGLLVAGHAANMIDQLMGTNIVHTVITGLGRA